MLNGQHHSHQSAERMSDNGRGFEMVGFDVEIDGVGGRLKDGAGGVRARGGGAKSRHLDDVQSVMVFELFCGRVPHGAGAGESRNEHDVRSFAANGDGDAVRCGSGESCGQLQSESCSEECFEFHGIELILQVI